VCVVVCSIFFLFSFSHSPCSRKVHRWSLTFAFPWAPPLPYSSHSSTSRIFIHTQLRCIHTHHLKRKRIFSFINWDYPVTQLASQGGKSEQNKILELRHFVVQHFFVSRWSIT
jgi:hypothetical protein